MSLDDNTSGSSVNKLAAYAYDAFERRMSKMLDMRYLHGAAVDQILAQETAGGTVRWHLADHQGTVRDLATNTGDVTGSHVVFDSFGNVKSGTLGTRFAYTGQEYDSSTGLYYYNARWYKRLSLV